MICADVDIDCLEIERINDTSFLKTETEKQYRICSFDLAKFQNGSLLRQYNPHPFIATDPLIREDRFKEITQIQIAGLAKRLEHTGSKKLIIGISGGLDSTLALLVAAKTFDALEIPRENIIAVTMPGFGTTDTTLSNALKLIKSVGAHPIEIDIREACKQHFKDLGHDPDIFDVTYENVQARERTQILMNLANKMNGLVLGTGDLSELALGWCTYNGDHMSMYSINCSIPKTLVKHMVKWLADEAGATETRNVLYSILDTPITPELLPPDAKGKILQKTEDVIGPYELHDFFLYHTIRYGTPPEKMLLIASHAFEGIYDKIAILKWMKVFYKRFFGQQFKRSCMPDGPKVGSVSLSPRGNWKMPSDAEAMLWLENLNKASNKQ